MGELDEDMACQELAELVTAYLEGYVAAAERARFEERLATCSGCRTYLEQMRMTLRALDRVPEQSISIEAREQLLRLYRAWQQRYWTTVDDADLYQRGTETLIASCEAYARVTTGA